MLNKKTIKLCMLFMLADNLYAASSAAPKAIIGGEMVFLVLLLGVMYFVMIRPQAQRAKEHRNLLTNISQGDEVVTNGGLLGKVSKIVDKFLVLKIADGVEVVIQKQAIVALLPNGTIKSL